MESLKANKAQGIESIPVGVLKNALEEIVSISYLFTKAT